MVETWLLPMGDGALLAWILLVLAIAVYFKRERDRGSR